MRQTIEEKINLLNCAYDDLKAAAIIANADKTRPEYHFRSPSQCLSDPDAGDYYKGYYHLMFGLNPNGSKNRSGMIYKTKERIWNPDSPDWTGGITCWGHARSRDLLHWEFLPLAITPDIKNGEDLVWFGCSRINKEGVPIAFYTSVGPDKRPEDTANQHAALGDDDLIIWKHYEKNPVLDYDLHGNDVIREWRDPCIFSDNGKTYMALGAALPKEAEGFPIITYYEAQNAEFTKWIYKGILFKYHDKEVPSIECPTVFKIDDKLVILLSPHKEVEYYVGKADLENCKFDLEKKGFVDYSNQYYATAIMHDPIKKRAIIWASIFGAFKHARGWQTCFALPREMTLAKDGTLIQIPLSELKQLRTKKTTICDTLKNEERELKTCTNGKLEIVAEFPSKPGIGLVLTYGKNRVEFVIDEDRWKIVDLQVPYDKSLKKQRVHIFVDNSMVDVFINNKECITRVIEPCNDGFSVLAIAQNCNSDIKADIWDINASNLFTSNIY